MRYVIDHIPTDTPCNRRPGYPMKPETITIHNTGNPDSTAKNERGWLTNPNNTRTASYHIVVDEREAIECIPLNESAWHAGDGKYGSGNRKSIGIEICESGDREKNEDNAADLVAQLLIDRGWGIDRLRRHYDWSGKICPRLMYDAGTWAGWKNFKMKVQQKIEEKEGEQAMNLADWQWKMLEDAIPKLDLDTPGMWLKKVKDKSLTTTELAWLNTILLSRKPRP